MATYIIFSHLLPGSFCEPRDFKKIADTVAAKLKKECLGVTWKASYATLGSVDIVDVVEADDPQEVGKAAMLIRAYGNSTTETLLATPWKDFIKGLSQ